MGTQGIDRLVSGLGSGSGLKLRYFECQPKKREPVQRYLQSGPLVEDWFSTWVIEGNRDWVPQGLSPSVVESLSGWGP